MKSFGKTSLSVGLLIVLAISCGEAIKCYHCDSLRDQNCAIITKTSSLYQTECKTSVLKDDVGGWLKELTRIDFFEIGEIHVPMVCEKIIAKNGDGQSITYRSCQLDGGKTDTCVQLRSTASRRSNIEIIECATCSEDGCNKSTTLQLTNLWLLVIPLVLLNLFA